MRSENPLAGLSQAKRPRMLLWLSITAALTVLLVLTQAVFAGRGLYINRTEFDIHGGLGMLTLLLSIVQFGLTVAAGFPRGIRWRMLVPNGLLMVLVFIQLMLGEAGRTDTTAASLHVPNGVLIFGLSAGIAAILWSRGRAPRELTT